MYVLSNGVLLVAFVLLSIKKLGNHKLNYVDEKGEKIKQRGKTFVLTARFL